MYTAMKKAAVAASIALALGSGCSGNKGGNSTPGGVTPGVGAGAPGGQSSGTGGSGNVSGQTMAPGGASAAGGSGQSSTGAAVNGGAAGSAGGAASGGTGVSTSGGNAGASGITSAGGAASGGATSDVDGGCCKTADCQPDAVKTCVCTQWQQSQCCSGAWDEVCQATAELKCNAAKCGGEPPSTTTPDGGDIVKGACCATHSTPGCADTATEQCICGLLADCCTNQWDSVCVQLVREKHCEPGVRDCVCTTWQQQSCCDTDWTDSCGLVATSKCGAQPECP
ncbi:MAG TPA: hypothetical protein VHC69_05060 [Polyangiaceae bacterium]|nr:hypothetical protein [Polyangiaceae bacterium]